MKKYLITGVTGSLGKAVLDGLLQKVSKDEIAVLVRNEEKASELKNSGIDVRIGDYNNESTLIDAFQGVEKLYFVSSSDLSNRTEQHLNVVHAATKANVKQVVYTSFQRRNETASSPIAAVAQSHLDTEKALMDSGLNYTILKHGLYMDLLPWFIGEQFMENKSIYLPAGEGRAAFILREDLADLAVNILTTAGHENKIYNAFAESAPSMREIATEVSGIVKQEITYVSPFVDEFMTTLSQAGVPAEVSGMLVGFSSAIAAGEFSEVSTDIIDLLGRKPTSVSSFLEQVYKA